ncbi:membrane hypothetical protein [Desulfamplus magnetovallimortis]|uniref:Uncharacterized protein n=1 Tax=Desulfamplus magnetovallimortis TaxID=1246637 RepID=A0A1W1HEN5_9BACT|nr:hypothetical protein [Desulfamplus magnetovallimortis]SLM30930.1 membrane hypothetical protein [Desulfamplus magnetovallimortis]
MNIKSENSNANEQHSDLGKNARQIAILLSIDILLIIGALLYQGDRGDIGKIVHWSAIWLHTPIGIWIGIIIKKMNLKRYTVIVYWISVVVPFFLFVEPFALRPFYIFFPFGILPTSIVLQWLILLAVISKYFSKGTWPLPVAILFTIFGMFLVGFNLSFKTTEFGPLGMLFGNILVSPFFLALPALITIPANDKIKKDTVRLQKVTYIFTILAWIIFVIKAFF